MHSFGIQGYSRKVIKKLVHKFKVPLKMPFMMPTMLLGMPAIMTNRKLQEGSPFLQQWLLMVIFVGGLAKLFVTKILLEANEASVDKFTGHALYNCSAKYVAKKTN